MPNLGFENLRLRGLDAQRQDAARALREGGLSGSDKQQVDELQATDRRVRAHEQAHMAAGRELVRGSSLTYETGPDHKRYAVGGDVTIDASPGATPEETMAKAAHIRDAALAPADPSPQDRQVAAEASRMELTARQEANQQAEAEKRQAEQERSSQAISAYREVEGEGQVAAGFFAVA